MDKLNEQFAKIKLLCIDMDHVLTCGGIFHDDTGRFYKRFSIRDGVGIKLLKQAGVEIAVVTGDPTNLPFERFRDRLGLDYIFGSCVDNKAEIVKSLMEELSLKKEEVAFIGDDVQDIDAMKLVGMPIAPCDAMPIMQREVNIVYVTDKCGGYGAVREVCDKIMQAKFQAPTYDSYIKRELRNKEINKVGDQLVDKLKQAGDRMIKATVEDTDKYDDEIKKYEYETLE